MRARQNLHPEAIFGKPSDFQTYISNNCGSLTILQEDLLKTIVKASVTYCGLSTVARNPALEIHFIDSEEISRINRDFLNHEGPTDVISFSYEDDCLLTEDEYTIGEIFVCPDVAAKSARELGCTESEELVYYIVHGILHLTGYDDHTESDIKEMRLAEKNVMGKLKEDHCLRSLVEVKELS